MKKTILKLIAVSAMGISLSACTFLNDMGITKGNITKMASYKHEVTFKEFVHALNNSEFTEKVNKDDFMVKDGVADLGLDLEMDEQILNYNFENKVRSKMEAKGSVALSAAYDSDNETIDATLKDELNYEMDHPFLGESTSKHKGNWNYIFQPKGKGYALANKNDQTYFDITTGENFSLRTMLTSFFKMGGQYLGQFEQMVNENADEIDKAMKEYNLKFYVDSNVYTVKGNYNGSTELGTTRYYYNNNTGNYDYEKDVYGQMQYKLDIVFQIKLTKVTQIRAEVEGALAARFTEDHNAIAGGLFSLLDIATTSCVKGDEETINLKAAAGINFEQKDVSNKPLDLSNYKLLNPLS